MEISERQLEQMLGRQADRVAKESDARIDKRFEKWSREADVRMQRYIGVLQEDFDEKFQTILEYTKDIPAMKEQQDVMFEQIGTMAEDITIIKETVKDHEHRLQKLEAA